MLTGLLLILALSSSVVPKMLASLRARRQISSADTQHIKSA
jgi:hypothetical protein